MKFQKSSAKSIKAHLKNRIAIVLGLALVAIVFYNFTSDNTDHCPARLSYEEVKQSIALKYCRNDNGSYNLKLSYSNDAVIPAKLQLIVNGEKSITDWNAAQLIVEKLPSYVLVSLLYEHACEKSNSPDVSFPIKFLQIENCDLPAYVVESKERLDDTQEVEIVDAMLEKNLDGKNMPDLLGEKTVVKRFEQKNNDERKVESKKSIVSSSSILTNAPPITNNTKALSSIQRPKAKISDAGANQQKEIHIQEEVLEQHSNGLQLKTNEYSIPIVESPVPTTTSDRPNNEFSQNGISETPDITKATEMRQHKTTFKPTSHIGSALFNPKTIGISKSCTHHSLKYESKTDLFIITIKPEQTISLLDIYCHASTNSEMTVTLSQLGQQISSFDVLINKGENQIGLNSLGTLQIDEAYLLEFKTKHIGDLYQFDSCNYTHSPEKNIVVRYLDNHSSFYGLTIENE